MFPRNALNLAIYLTVSAFLLTSCAPAAAPALTPKPTAPTPKPAAPAKAPVAETPAAKPAAPAATPKPGAEQPKYGGLLTIIQSADPGHLDLQRTKGPLHALVGPAYSGLLQWDANDPDKVAPDLTEKWEATPDGKTYTFQLRKDVKWHDGKPFTSTDAKFSIERLADKASVHAPMLKAVEKAEAPDPYTLKLSLKYPSAALPTLLTNSYLSIFPKHVLEAKGDMKASLVGTGAFKLKAYNTYVSLEMVKNPDYFVKGLPYLDAVTYFFIRDRSTQLAAFRVGNGKITSLGVPINKLEADQMRKAAPNANIIPVNRLRALVFNGNSSLPGWKDVRVRKAVYLAWDHQAAIKVVGEGAGEVGTSMLVGGWALPKDEVLKLPGFRQPKDADRAEAKKLLAEAGLAQGFTTKVMVRADYPEDVKLAEFAVDQLKTIGITGIVDAQEGVVFLDRKFRVSFESIAEGTVLDNTDPDGGVRQFASPNERGFSDPEIDKLFAQQSQTLDVAERKKLVRQMELRVIDQAWYINSHWSENYLFAWPDVKNGRPKVPGPTNNSRFIRNIWLEK